MAKMSARDRDKARFAAASKEKNADAALGFNVKPMVGGCGSRNDLFQYQRAGWAERVSDERQGKMFCRCGAEVTQMQAGSTWYLMNVDGSRHERTHDCVRRIKGTASVFLGY